MKTNRVKITIDSNCKAAIFDMDGVVTNTADHHARAWKHTFDQLNKALQQSDMDVSPFDLESDYNTYLSGRSRIEGIRAFLASRLLSLPEGTEGNSSIETVQGIATIKNNLYRKFLDEIGADVYEDAIVVIKILKAQCLKIGLASASKNASSVLDKTNLRPLFDVIVDGNDMAANGLRSKPAPDIFLYVAECLGVPFSQCAVFEDSHETLEQASRMSPLHAIGVERWHASTEDGRFGNLPAFSDLRSISLQAKKR